jgi:hypothetical protein
VLWLDVSRCNTLQANLTAKLAGRYGSTVEVQKSGALLLAGTEMVSTQLQLDSYGQHIGCVCLLWQTPLAQTSQLTLLRPLTMDAFGCHLQGSQHCG